jgi:translation initiation factor 1
VTVKKIIDMCAKKKKNNTGGMVFSTNPDFNPDDYVENEEVESVAPEKQSLRVMLDRKQRKGKVVTLITGFEGPEEELQELGKKLKSSCGTGGSVKNGEIIIQGDFATRILDYLKNNGFTKTKKSGG